MPRHKRRQNEANGDGETSETDENYVNASGGNSSSNRVGAGEVGEHGDGNGNDRVSNNTSSGRSRQSRGTSSQHEYQLSLGPWTQAVHTAVQSMGAAHQAIKDLQDKFTLHIDDLHMMEETRTRLNQLEDECEAKGNELMRQEHAIAALARMNQKMEGEIEGERKGIEEEKKELEQKKAKLENRVSVAMAEERHELARNLKELTTQHTENYEKLRKELQDEFTRKRDENDRRVTTLVAENKQLSTIVEEQKRTIETHLKELGKTTEQCDVLERAKDSVKKEKRTLEKELEMMKKEFALSPKSKDYLYVF
jgi:chromosome segregation ATPase